MVRIRISEPSHEKTNNLGFSTSPTQTGLYSHRSRLVALNFGLNKQKDRTIRVAKTKALVSCVVLCLCFRSCILVVFSCCASLVAAISLRGCNEE